MDESLLYFKAEERCILQNNCRVIGVLATMLKDEVWALKCDDILYKQFDVMADLFEGVQEVLAAACKRSNQSED